MSNQLKAFEINCDKFTEKKNGLTYLSWANAWSEFKQIHPEATYNIKKNEQGIPLFGNSALGYIVYTDVTVENVTHEMWLPVMNGANKPMKDEAYTIKSRYGKEQFVDAINMFDINKTVMRCLTKNLAMFGLGINIYKGEDFPEEVKDIDRPAQSPNITNAPADEDFIKQIKDLTDNYFGTPKGSVVDATLEKCLKYYKVDKVEDVPKAKLKGVFNKLVESVA